jgi:hypothetical protein
MSDKSDLKRIGRKLFPQVNRPWYYFYLHPRKPGGFIWKIDYWLYIRRRHREIRDEAIKAGKPWPPPGSN